MATPLAPGPRGHGPPQPLARALGEASFAPPSLLQRGGTVLAPAPCVAGRLNLTASRPRHQPEGPLCACALALPPSRGARLRQSVCRTLSSEQGEARRLRRASGPIIFFSLPLSRPTSLFTPLPPLLAQPWRSRRRPLSPHPSPRHPPWPSPLRPVAAAGAREPAPPWGRRAAAPPVLVRRAGGPRPREGGAFGVRDCKSLLRTGGFSPREGASGKWGKGEGSVRSCRR